MTLPVAFSLDAIHFSYRGHEALKGVSLSIAKGERVALMGANGSGKSTLLRLMDALYYASSGQFIAFGQPVSEDAFGDDKANFAFRQKVGLVFQNPDVQLFNPTVMDELAFGPLQLGWERERILSAIDAMLGRFGIAHLRDRSPHRLSGGEKKRVALASVLITEPEVLLLDEPTAALDPHSREELVNLLRDGLSAGQTVITATHDLDIVEEISSRAIVLDQGTVAADAPVLDVLHDVDLLRRTHLIYGHRHHHSHGHEADHAVHLHVHETE